MISSSKITFNLPESKIEAETGDTVRHIVYNLEILFDTVTKEDININTDITNNLLENNTYVQDHIAVQPITYTLSGVVSEKVYTAPESVAIRLPVYDRQASLNSLSAFFPKTTTYIRNFMIKVDTIWSKVDKVVQNLKNIKKIVNYPLGLLGAKYPKYVSTTHRQWSVDKRQADVFHWLKLLCDERYPVSVNTGWGFEVNKYYIASVNLSQGNTYQQSDLVVTLREIKTVSTEVRAITADELNRYYEQMQDVETLNQTKLQSMLYTNTLGDDYEAYKKRNQK